MSKYTKYLQDEIIIIKKELKTYLGDKDIEPLFVAQLKDFEESLVNSLEKDEVVRQADIAWANGEHMLSIDLMQSIL